MNSLDAMIMGMANKGREPMVFDWDAAARMIVERKPKTVGAGLSGDWEYTGGTIFDDGAPVTNSYTYLASTWATPEIEIDGETIDCYRMKSAVSDWDSDTKWPPSAIAILAAGGFDVAGVVGK